MQVLLWTSKSVRKLASELRERGHEAHYTTIAALLRSLGYSLRSNRKTLEGSQHPDRDAQFRYINERVGAAVTAGQPAISIDTKKKELVGEFTNAGREWRPKGKPEKTLTHDFPSDAKGKAIPFGVYDIAANEGFVNVGTVPSYCTSCSPLLGFEVSGVRHALAEFLLDVGPERDHQSPGGAAPGLKLAVADPVVDSAA